MQNDGRAAFVFILIKKFLCIHLKSEFKTCKYEQNFVVWKPIMIQYATYTSVMWNLFFFFLMREM